MPSKSTLARFRLLVVTWFRRHGRPLPWRATRDPYRILVSEFMLQQTQVSRVEGYYDAFLSRYPTIQDLAAARPRAVRESWEGLGYYRRAENLHRLARAVVREQAGELPRDRDGLRALPGVGEYTAGAVMAFAHEVAEPAIDTNVSRVLRRAFHPRTGADAAGRRRLHATAKALLGRDGPRAWAMSQGIMELGALVCTARAARCEICPARPACATGRRGIRAASPRR
ncbi:MAG: hypothetical protein R2909_14605 [Gemmatimonadales bacterium]